MVSGVLGCETKKTFSNHNLVYSYTNYGHHSELTETSRKHHIKHAEVLACTGMQTSTCCSSCVCFYPLPRSGVEEVVGFMQGA